MNSRTTGRVRASAELIDVSLDLCNSSVKEICSGRAAIERSREQLQRSWECLLRSQTLPPESEPVADDRTGWNP